MKEQIEYRITIPKYEARNGFEFPWYGDHEIYFEIEKDTAIIRANGDGLISLANHFLALAQEDIPSGYHIHLDELGAFEGNSDELIIEKL